MPFDAKVVRVLIASPGDTGNVRKLMREVIEDWNSVNAVPTKVVLLPLMWERDATPELGERPQGVINRQLVDDADLLVGAFWTRLGTPTGVAESGTAEEIERMAAAGKPVLVYFSNEPVAPQSIDLAEYERLLRFKERMQQAGVHGTYASESELLRDFNADLGRTIHKRFGTLLSATATPVTDVPRIKAAPLVTIEREQVFRGSRVSNNHYLSVTNQGTGVAQDLSIQLVAAEGATPPMLVDHEKPIGRLPPGGSVRFPLVVAMGFASQFDAHLTWEEGSTTTNDLQTLRV